MLAIRMQRTGRKGHAQFRVVVQDARFTPTSGRIVTRLGSYNPHTKAVVLDKEKASFYLGHGAQPSERVVRILKAEGVKLPEWVKTADSKKRDIRNPEKLRKNQPEQPPEEAAPEAQKDEATPEATEPKETDPAGATEEKPAAETPKKPDDK